MVHNGTALPDPAAAVPRTPYPSVCVLGRLVPHKRVELALEAAARIRPHLPELKVLVVGQGYWEPRLRETVDRLGLGDAVELLGWVDEETKQRVLASSWALAMPSVKEGWGLAVLEAAASGTPTVAFRAAGGLRESVVHGSTGLLADDPEEFTRHLAWVLLNRHLRERLGEAARAHAARFTWPEAVAGFAAVVDAATAAHARPADTPVPAGEEPAKESAFGRRPETSTGRAGRLARPVDDQGLGRDRGGVLAGDQDQRGDEGQDQGAGGQRGQGPQGQPAHSGPPWRCRAEDTNRRGRKGRDGLAQTPTSTARTSRSAATTGAAGGAGKRTCAGRPGTR